MVIHAPFGRIARRKLLAVALSLGSPLLAAESSLWSDAEVRCDGKGALAAEPVLRHASGPVLAWTTSEGGELLIHPPEVAGAKGMDFFIFYDEKRPAKLELTVLTGDGEAVAKVELFPDGRGWRRVTAVFTDDGLALCPGARKNPSRLALRCTSGEGSTVWLGKPAWLKNPPFRRTADPHCPSIYGLRSDPYARSTREWLAVFQQPIVAEKSAAGADLDAVAARYDAWALGSGKDAGPLGAAIAVMQAEWIQNARRDLAALKLRREGRFIASSENKGKPLADTANLLAPLAVDWRRAPDPSKLEAIALALDFLEQEGFGNAPDPVGESTMQFARLKFSSFAHAAALLREPLRASGRLDWARRTLRWYSRAGEWDGKLVLEVNSDVLRGEAAARFIYALLAPEPGNRAFELGRLSRWLSECLVVSSNQFGLIKPDFTVYHHRAPYLVEYGPHALTAASTLATWLSGSPWALPAETRERLEACGDALLDISRGFSVPISTRGRFPGANRTLPSSLPLYLALSQKPCFSGRHAESVRALVGALGENESQTLLAKSAVYLRFLWMGSMGMAEQAALCFASPPKARDTKGFFAFNWAQVSTAKAAGWTAQAQGYSRWVFDFETGNFPSIENDWGRYLRYGTLELWSGDQPHDPVSSGWTIEHGWDWSLLPGATTLLLPYKQLGFQPPPAKRLMRNFSDRKFCAGLAGGAGFGAFGFELHDLAYPGKLEARKSVFVAGDLLLCLGSAIRSELAGVSAVTTLFQFGLAPGAAPLGDGNEATVEVKPAGDPSMRFRDPAGNEFAFIQGKSLKRRQGIQTGPTSAGKITTGNYDTLWIDHGARPEGEGYAYAIAPNVGGRSALRPRYEILERGEGAHVVRFPESHKTAYVLFAPLSRPIGELQEVDRPCLIWIGEASSDRRELSVCDPDLNYPAAVDSDEASEAVSVPTRVVLKLAGRWRLEGGEAVVQDGASSTKITITCSAGAPVRILLRRG